MGVFYRSEKQIVSWAGSPSQSPVTKYFPCRARALMDRRWGMVI